MLNRLSLHNCYFRNMSNFKKISHVLYRCRYHIVWTPKYRYRVLEGLVKAMLSKDIPILFEWKSSGMIEMNIQKDHIHLIVSVPPKVSVLQSWNGLIGRVVKVVFPCLTSLPVQLPPKHKTAD